MIKSKTYAISKMLKIMGPEILNNFFIEWIENKKLINGDDFL